MITRAKAKASVYPEGSYYVGQGAYTLEVLEIVSSSLNYTGRTTPGGACIILQGHEGTTCNGTL
eukprot:527639-Prorocentrum_lima.AAC.1